MLLTFKVISMLSLFNSNIFSKIGHCAKWYALLVNFHVNIDVEIANTFLF